MVPPLVILYHRRNYLYLRIFIRRTEGKTMDFREKIIEYLAQKDYAPLKAYELFEALVTKIHDDAAQADIEAIYEDFSDSLSELIEDASVVLTKRNKLVLAENSSYIKGIFRATTHSFGFVTPDEQYRGSFEGDLFVSPEDRLGAINGDSVLAALKNSSRGKRSKGGRNISRSESTECRIVRILSHSVTHVNGTLVRSMNYRRKGSERYYLEPDDSRLGFSIRLKADELGNARPGDKLEVELELYPGEKDSEAHGKITKIYGESSSREANYLAILSENGIKTEFDPKTLEDAELRAAEAAVLSSERTDLRDMLIFTLDGADAKDLDDAISLERRENGYLLGVHIADVSHYVKEGSPLDREAFERGTSIYFTDKVVPMLPKQLSNGICSLTAGTDKYALSAFIELDRNGNILNCTLRETIISSKIRGVYSELNDVIEKNRDSEFYEKYSILFPDTLPLMIELYEKLECRSKKRGALELETSEAKIILDEDGIPVDIVKRERGTGEKMIEQFMLCANEAVASWLFWQDMPCVYRIHEEPSPEKVRAFKIFAHNAGLDVSALNAKTLRPSAYQNLIEQANEREIGTVVSYVMLRSLMKARYSSTCAPHFGLALEHYCHFTSPIRRYPDLSVHRIIKELLNGSMSGERQSSLAAFADSSATESSENELRAIRAERDIEDLYRIIFMQSKIGEEFNGIISSVTSFGFFVELENTCEGLVHISTLRGHYDYNEQTISLVCGQKSFRLGDTVRVKLERADIITRKLDMLLIEKDGERQRSNNRNGKWKR